jgi:IS30 family transposase
MSIDMAITTTEIWPRWTAGHSMSDIARALGLRASGVYASIARTGGFAPRPRRRAARALTVAEREDISRGLAAGDSFRQLARQLGRPPSTVSREVGRHGGRTGYRATVADQAAWARSRRPKRCRLACCGPLRRVVVTKLRQDWSPDQIAAWLRRTYPDNPAMHVSHETIYRTLFVQARGVLKRDLLAHLRQGRRMRRPKPAGRSRRGQILEAVSIRERPPTADDRAVPGHWEGDLLAGAQHSHIATLVERSSRLVVLVRLAHGKDSRHVVRALARRVRTLPQGLMTSLTWDRGTELAAHKTFTVATDVRVYFCDPHSPWQRGSNENTNGLLRQYLPDGTDLSTVSQAQLNRIARRLNTRPRKTLGYRTPATVFAESVALTR